MGPKHRVDLSVATASRPLEGSTAAFSGATLERIELPDGQRIVVKHLPPQGDWLTRATHGSGRVRELWESGLLSNIEPLVDHTIIDIKKVDDHDAVLMRDASDDLVPARRPVSVATIRALLTGLSAMHDGCVELWTDDTCSIAARYSIFAPAFHAQDDGPNAHPRQDRILRGWDLFQQHVDADVVAAVFAVHRDPGPIGRNLARFAPTLLHGDAKLENLGLRTDEFVAIDWGDLTGFGPREIDIAWFALTTAARIGCTADEIFREYESGCSGPMKLEPLDLACVGALAQMGFRLAIAAFDSGSEGSNAASAQLTWWVARVRRALDRLGSI